MRLISSLLRLSVPLAFWLGVWGGSAHAGVVQVAVAANFAAPFQKIAAGFEADTGHQAQAIIGSTGKFHTQIRAGAPFDVLLAADDETPRQLESEGLAVKGQRFTYAKGKLVLWSAQAGLVDPQGEVLHKGAFKRLALAHPKLAPYGAAAVQALQCLGVYERLSERLVMGDNIAQAWQFVSTGNAELGLLALSQVAVPDRPRTGSWWMVPARCYTPILQDAALLTRGEHHAPARALLNYLKGDKARAVIQSYGYDL
ncbi:MAG TPA: molybdate ABC transporter substrate-binding protein [Aquabacterium sp.]|uniref:molybdate ABC transporter substrate-binding protein n=1 Tax=Aquabacterium sp. TaxID=1872578 RepID=UPI002E339798|nr:molybdate ABC transporter substrate-binding protein [Aquabacterium sp.]HEX5373893.1 molybdate ABC transporter substrate-binding protein [Aquabacterium sp.]